MNPDLTLLSRRVHRLETLIGSADEAGGSGSKSGDGEGEGDKSLKERDIGRNLGTTLGRAHSDLRKQVPDEAVAAYRALIMLNKTITLTGPSLSNHLTQLHQHVSTLEPQLRLLHDMIHTQNSIENAQAAHERQLHVPPAVPQTHHDQLTALANRVEKLYEHVNSEESDLDELLINFDTATARLNSSILNVSSQLR